MKMDFKVITHLKVNWLKHASENGGAMKMVIDSKPKENNIVWNAIGNATYDHLVEMYVISPESQQRLEHILTENKRRCHFFVVKQIRFMSH